MTLIKRPALLASTLVSTALLFGCQSGAGEASTEAAPTSAPTTAAAAPTQEPEPSPAPTEEAQERRKRSPSKWSAATEPAEEVPVPTSGRAQEVIAAMEEVMVSEVRLTQLRGGTGDSP